MKHKFSFVALLISVVTFFIFRFDYSDANENYDLKLTTWDAFGYYMYLPSGFIYDDYTELKWVDSIDAKYDVVGGELYQSNIHSNGNYVNKYLGGIAILQLPWFAVGHAIASSTDYPADGFSAPYQYSLAFGLLVYFILALFILRNILLRYYDDLAVAISIVLVCLATNLIQYVAIEACMTHGYIFLLYVLVLHFTIKWHEKPSVKWSVFIGLTIGLATICRPTELIMFFIPLLWGTQNKESKKQKWALVKTHRKEFIIILVSGLIGMLPQLIYWKLTSGSFIYDVGSSWRFLTPFFQVLFGFTNGWFIYTPITILFIVGMFFMKDQPFKKSVIVFCLLNIWIVIAWSDWKYGATYSTRALVQSYPIFILPFTAIISKILQYKWKWAFYFVGAYLIFVNLFQIGQYNKTFLHFRDMTREYYGRIYLNSTITPLDASLMDNTEVVDDLENYTSTTIISKSDTLQLTASEFQLGSVDSVRIPKSNTEQWLKITASAQANIGFDASYLTCKVYSDNDTLENKARLFNPISYVGKLNPYEFHMRLDPSSSERKVLIGISNLYYFEGAITDLNVEVLEKK